MTRPVPRPIAQTQGLLLCMTGGQAGYATPDWSDPAKPWKLAALTSNSGKQAYRQLAWTKSSAKGNRH